MEQSLSCLHPITCVNPKYRAQEKDGYKVDKSAIDYKLSVPCGHCILCRRKRASSWHFRLYQEALSTPHTTTRETSPLNILFCTFTFNNELLPDDNPDGLRTRLAPYIRIWRDRWRKRHGVSPRYFAITDIGSSESGTQRLHLHILIFNPVDKNGQRIGKSRIYMTGESWRKHHPDTPIPSRFQCDWPFGYVSYCSLLKGIEGIHYVSGYISNRNVMRSIERGLTPKKHGRAIARKALQHNPVVFCSNGLGSAFVYTKDFAKLKKSKGVITRIGQYTYAVPRYYRLKMYDTIEIPVESAIYITPQAQLSQDNYIRNYRLWKQTLDDHLPLVYKFANRRFSTLEDLERLTLSLDKVYGAPSPRPVFNNSLLGSDIPYRLTTTITQQTLFQ